MTNNPQLPAAIDLESALFGGAVGLLFGVIIGVSWTDAYCMIKVGLAERRKASRTECGAVNNLAVIMVCFAAAMTMIGVFQIITYTKLTDFVSCSARYDRQEYKAREARVKSQEMENKALYRWLVTIPPLIASGDEENDDDDPDPKVQKAFNKALKQALEKHKQRVTTEKANGFPANPEKTCGEY